MLRLRTAIIFACMICLLLPSKGLYAGPKKWGGYSEVGQASHYIGKIHYIHKVKRHRRYQTTITAAHRTLPFGTRVKVTNLRTGKSIIVVINDRGPFIRGRVIDLSTSAFRQIGELRKGLIRVKLEALS